MISSSFKSKLGFSSLAILASLFVNPVVSAMDLMEEDQQQGTKRKLEDSSTQQSNKRITTPPAENPSSDSKEEESELYTDANNLFTDEIDTLNLNEIKTLYVNLPELNESSRHKIVSNNFLTQLQNLTSLVLMTDSTTSDQVISPLTKLKQLHLATKDEKNTNITDASISPLTNLEGLSLLWQSTITDEGLMPLTNLTTLRSLCNDGIKGKCFSRLTNLRSLGLFSNNSITNEDLSQLTLLEDLHLGGNQNITFTAIREFTKLKALQTVKTPSLEHLISSSEERDLLKKNNPNIKIIESWDWACILKKSDDVNL